MRHTPKHRSIRISYLARFTPEMMEALELIRERTRFSVNAIIMDTLHAHLAPRFKDIPELENLMHGHYLRLHPEAEVTDDYS